LFVWLFANSARRGDFHKIAARAFFFFENCAAAFLFERALWCRIANLCRIPLCDPQKIWMPLCDPRKMKSQGFFGSFWKFDEK
jgi:hypothetical protein